MVGGGLGWALRTMLLLMSESLAMSDEMLIMPSSSESSKLSLRLSAEPSLLLSELATRESESLASAVLAFFQCGRGIQTEEQKVAK